LFGGQRDDRIFGGPGRDQLKGKEGFDDLHGGLKADSKLGGPGKDSSSAIAERTPTRPARGRHIEWRTRQRPVVGWRSRDFLAGRTGADDLNGGDGFDFFNLTGDGDLVSGGAPVDGDVVRYPGLAGLPATVDLAAHESRLTGQAAVDRIFGVSSIEGTPGDDVLLGDDGPHLLLGDRGDDLLDGRGGIDGLLGEAGEGKLRSCEAT
jgi:Ca2+-binding RTX toxin-like protein